MEKLLNHAKMLDEEESGGHGDKFAVFDDDLDAVIATILPLATREGKIIANQLDDPSLLPEGERPAIIFHYPSDAYNDTDSLGGIVSIIAPIEEDGETHNTFITAYPAFESEWYYDAQINLIEIFPNTLEARLWLQIPELPFSVCVFDTLYALYRGTYEADTSYEFFLSGLAYIMSPTEGDSFTIDDPDDIRRHRATDAWIEKHGRFNRETDLETALKQWEPSSPEDLEPILFDLSRRRSYLPHDTYADDANFAGKVLKVVPDALKVAGKSFWRVDVAIGAFEDEDQSDFLIPYFITEERFKGEWRPIEGEWVAGNGWINAYARIKDTHDQSEY